MLKGGELLPLLPDLARAGTRRALTPLRVAWRRSFLYRRFLKGQLADHIVFHPWDALPRRLEEADALLRGRFRFHGHTVEVPDGVSVFDVKPPSAAWHEALHSFSWLPALPAAVGDARERQPGLFVVEQETRMDLVEVRRVAEQGELQAGVPALGPRGEGKVQEAHRASVTRCATLKLSAARTCRSGSPRPPGRSAPACSSRTGRTARSARSAAGRR